MIRRREIVHARYCPFLPFWGCLGGPSHTHSPIFPLICICLLGTILLGFPWYRDFRTGIFAVLLVFTNSTRILEILGSYFWNSPTRTLFFFSKTSPPLPLFPVAFYLRAPLDRKSDLSPLHFLWHLQVFYCLLRHFVKTSRPETDQRTQRINFQPVQTG